MPLIIQNILVLTLVAGCLGWVVWQGVRSLRGRKSRIGSCCATGCPPAAKAKQPTERIVFMPVEMLSRRK